MNRIALVSALGICAICIGLACESPSATSPTPTPAASPPANPTPEPTPEPSPSPDPTDTPTNGEPTPPPTDPGSVGTNGVGSNGVPLTCLEDEVMVSVSSACNSDGTGLGCCPAGFPLVTDDCFCAAEIDGPPGPTPAPQPTPPPYACANDEVLVRVPADCARDDTGWGCCPADLPTIDSECFCTEFVPPE